MAYFAHIVNRFYAENSDKFWVYYARFSICLYIDLYDSIEICRHFQGFLICCRKGENLPTYPHTKNPQDVDNPVDNLGSYTNQLSICLP